MTSTITAEQQQAIIDFLKDKHIPSGLGNIDEACSMAAINLALTGRLTDDIPLCMSKVIGRWIICIQDRMTDDMRNSPEWRALLPLAAGTGRKREHEHLAIILDWMWMSVLPHLTPVAEKYDFGDAWKTMLHKRTGNAADAAADAAAYATAYATKAADAAYAAADAAHAAAYAAADAAHAAAYAAADAAHAAAYAAADAAHAAAYAANATKAAAHAANAAANAAAHAADATAHAADATKAADDYWRSTDPVSLLRKLVA